MHKINYNSPTFLTFLITVFGLKYVIAIYELQFWVNGTDLIGLSKIWHEHNWWPEVSHCILNYFDSFKLYQFWSLSYFRNKSNFKSRSYTTCCSLISNSFWFLFFICHFFIFCVVQNLNFRLKMIEFQYFLSWFSKFSTCQMNFAEKFAPR